MFSQIISHTDERRKIYDFAQGEFKSAKAVIVIDEIPIGDHHHNNKTEEFLLLLGSFIECTVGEQTERNVPAPVKLIIPPGTYHKFICKRGSILLGVATELFDPTDEIKKQ